MKWLLYLKTVTSNEKYAHLKNPLPIPQRTSDIKIQHIVFTKCFMSEQFPHMNIHDLMFCPLVMKTCNIQRCCYTIVATHKYCTYLTWGHMLHYCGIIIQHKHACPTCYGYMMSHFVTLLERGTKFTPIMVLPKINNIRYRTEGKGGGGGLLHRWHWPLHEEFLLPFHPLWQIL